MPESLSLEELKHFDSKYKKFGKETRFFCPLNGCAGKPRDNEHRSLSVNMDNGAWKCHRCSEKGLLKEYWTQVTSGKFNKRPKRDPLQGLKEKLASRKAQPDIVEPIDQPNILKQYPEYVASFESSPGAAYLLSRGISEDLAKTSGCGYAPKWLHWKQPEKGQSANIGIDRRVIFPVFGEAGNLVAIQGRTIDKEFLDSKVMTRGKKSQGVFSTPGALAAEIKIITEAPIDALSTATADYPAIATCGTSWPSWLLECCAFHTVGIAFDSDEAGDKAAEKLTTELKKVGAKPIRLRPIGKDWNECLMSQGAGFVKATIETALGIKSAPEETIVDTEELIVFDPIEDLVQHQEKQLTLDQLKALLREAREFVEAGQHLLLPFQINSEFDFISNSLNQKAVSTWLPVFLNEVDSTDKKTRKKAIREVVEIMQAVKYHLGKEGV